jgi:hypothetical protein
VLSSPETGYRQCICHPWKWVTERVQVVIEPADTLGIRIPNFSAESIVWSVEIRRVSFLTVSGPKGERGREAAELDSTRVDDGTNAGDWIVASQRAIRP